jgi:hypothetical protein
MICKIRIWRVEKNVMFGSTWQEHRLPEPYHPKKPDAAEVGPPQGRDDLDWTRWSSTSFGF